MDRWTLKKELGRKTIHLMMLLVIFVYFIFLKYFGHKTALFVLSIILVLMLELEYVRLELKMKLPLFSRLWEYRRKKEKKVLGADIFFMIGVVLCFAVFDVRVALTAVLMIIFGDIAAALIGKRFGRIWLLKKRALEGILAEFAIDVLIGFLFLRTSIWWLTSAAPSGMVIWPAVFIMAIVATAVETLTTKINDNLLVPLFAGLAGQVVLLVLGLI